MLSNKTAAKFNLTYLVVNLLVQVLDENVALASLAQGRVALGPHDAAARGSDTPIAGQIARTKGGS